MCPASVNLVKWIVQECCTLILPPFFNIRRWEFHGQIFLGMGIFRDSHFALASRSIPPAPLASLTLFSTRSTTPCSTVACNARRPPPPSLPQRGRGSPDDAPSRPLATPSRLAQSLHTTSKISFFYRCPKITKRRRSIRGRWG
jgi:hypothetical protein